MQLHHKVFSIPILFMVVLFSIGLIGIESNLNNELKKQFEIRLGNIATLALAFIPTNDESSINKQTPQLQALAKKIAAAHNNTLRVTYLNKQGKVLGDSELSLSQTLAIESHSERAEVKEALANKLGIAIRYSSTLKKEMIYVAKYNDKRGFITRISMPETSYTAAINKFRVNYSYIIIATLLAIIIFGTFIISWMRKAVADEHKRQTKKIANITREITLLQAMTNLLLSAETMREAGLILENIIPKLLPEYKGAIFIRSTKDSYYELSNWGGRFPGKVSEQSIACWKKQLTQRSAIIVTNDKTCNTERCDFPQKITCIGLYADEEILGVMQLYHEEPLITEQVKKTTTVLAEHISTALANVQLKTVLRKQATRDPLTNLYNRRFMLEHFEQTLNRAERQQSNLAVLMIDLDYFKQFNDQFGHEAGDMVLSNVAEQFKQNLRLEDIACRYGGEEFCIVCTDTGLRDAYILAEKLRRCVSELELSFKEMPLSKVTMSIGIAIFPNHALNTAELIAKADKALYMAKSRGRNCTVVAPIDASYQEQH